MKTRRRVLADLPVARTAAFAVPGLFTLNSHIDQRNQ